MSVARILNEAPMAERIDAGPPRRRLLHDFTDKKKRTVNTQALEKFAKLATAAAHDDKLFAITHTAIPTGPFPSVRECVSKLLDMTSTQKTPSSLVGPRRMRETYVTSSIAAAST